MLYPIFREPGYNNTSNPYIGRVLEGTQELVGELEDLCGPEDTIISARGELVKPGLYRALVQPLMYRRSLAYGKDHVGIVRGIALQLRTSEMLGGAVDFTFERLEIKRQRDERFFSVRAQLGGNAVRQQLLDERDLVRDELPLYAKRSKVVVSQVRIAETPSYAFAATVVERIHAHTGMTGELAEPQMLFTPPYGG